MKVKNLLVSDMYAKGWFVFLIVLFVVLNGVMFFQWDSNLNYLAMFNAIVIYFDSFFIVAFIVNAFSFIFKKGIYEK
ncbi:hypothetical protein NK678_002218 [Salmonella enterica]|nr:hypothetical protein [Salmonella enterica]EDV6136293.1 hypothetical protein [Salmonella enterica subsp. enterica]QVA24657.1 hypothetical protein JYM84_04710 [Salmonella enterica subsp. enterica serovar Rubislaw]EEG1308964.1 hypothetical protein [Salmonella enterica]EFU8579518.1 hypothetical protein [Salmonella enterica]